MVTCQKKYFKGEHAEEMGGMEWAHIQGKVQKPIRTVSEKTGAQNVRGFKKIPETEFFIILIYIRNNKKKLQSGYMWMNNIK